MLKLVKSLLLGALVALPASSYAEDYPSREVTLIVPFAPGGTNDLTARFLADKLSKKWGKAVVVDNRPGAGSTLGMALVSKASADGYTLGLTSSSFTSAVAMMDKLPFDAAADLAPIVLVGRVDRFISTAKGSDIKNLGDLVAAAKSKKIFYGTTGVGGLAHFSGEIVNDALGIEMEPVHYKGGAEIMSDLAGGRLQIHLGSYSDLMTGLGTPIAIMSQERSATAPDILTVKEQGFPETIIPNWMGVFGPDGIPEQISQKIHADVTAVFNSDDGKAYWEKQAGMPGNMSTADFADYYKNEIGKFTEIAVNSGLKAKN